MIRAADRSIIQFKGRIELCRLDNFLKVYFLDILIVYPGSSPSVFSSHVVHPWAALLSRVDL